MILIKSPPFYIRTQYSYAAYFLKHSLQSLNFEVRELAEKVI